jgi:hypothetical protein
MHIRDPVYKDAPCTRKHSCKGSMCTRDEVNKDTLGTGIKKSSDKDALCTRDHVG